MVLKSEDGVVPDDLTPEEQQELENIRRRKQELLEDIQRLKDEIAEVTSEIENLGSTEERGIQFLIENDLLKNTSDDIAQFLYKGEGLNKTAIGDYLGERDEFNIQVLHAFVELHEFTDLNLVQALRQFLWSFRLPGEAQKIDRMMEAFAQRYCQCNPGVFQSTEGSTMEETYPEDLLRVSAALKLVNLYESIKNEPFKIPEDDGNDLTHTFFNPDREGWLLKLAPLRPSTIRTPICNNLLGRPAVVPDILAQGGARLPSATVIRFPFTGSLGDKRRSRDQQQMSERRVNQRAPTGWGRVKTWKRRWFILTDNCLYYFEYTTDKEPRGIIPLENLSIKEVEDKKPNCFELFIPDNKDQVIKACKTEADGRVVEGNHTFYRISAPTAEEKDEWMNSIKAAISRDPFYEMLATRKKKVSSMKRQ
ncbi:Cytohesin-2 PH, SEC7 and coiled-coil domain-containing protein 2 [Collichthys lucidus]|uniref:Cytohesin-2 PH, SEC7 and coiled-coil domain-containing protein 2 n=1 Tax=Collichthys lucidus TaxID=240159 RepID=A0A4U5VVF4_COLLU|nr:Cytohesin-2 PH, SEC7 and coiled-coil domain-containing protein 2 [Collichthys lucidus]